jgi:hypothetical protein
LTIYILDVVYFSLFAFWKIIICITFIHNQFLYFIIVVFSLIYKSVYIWLDMITGKELKCYIVWLPHTYSPHAVPPGDERAFYVSSIALPPSPYTRQKRELQFTASGYVLHAPRPTMLYRCGDRYAPIACLARLAAPTYQRFHGH